MEQFERDMTITWRLPIPIAIASLAGWREALACHSTLKQRHLEDMDDEIGGYRSNNVSRFSRNRSFPRYE